MNITCMLTDLFLLRRILDKDYVKTALIYTGNYHLSDTCHLLIKYFNFKITNITWSNISVEELNKKFKSYKKFLIGLKTFDELFFIVNPDLQNPLQCSNLFNFPPNLS